MTMAQRMITMRKNKGLSQEQLGNQLGVSRQAVSKWESGQVTPDVRYLITMCELFDVSADYLLRGVEVGAPTADPAIKDNVHDQKMERVVFVCGLLCAVAGLGILMLMPLFAELYRDHMFAVWHQALSVASGYITQKPLIYLVVLGSILLIAGAVLLLKRWWTPLLRRIKNIYY